MDLQFSLGQQVWLLNPKRSGQKVETGKISGISGAQKFHFKDIPENWFKVDVEEALQPKTALMFPNNDADQNIVANVVGTIVLWDQKHIKIAT
jgi:hypothetical protein